MSEHTPGPWTAVPMKARHPFGRCPDAFFEDGLWHIFPLDDASTNPLASVDRGDDHHAPTRKKAEANARLIAAAPELLEALKFVREVTDERYTNVQYVNELLAKIGPKVHAAIAKARAGDVGP